MITKLKAEDIVKICDNYSFINFPNCDSFVQTICFNFDYISQNDAEIIWKTLDYMYSKINDLKKGDYETSKL